MIDNKTILLNRIKFLVALVFVYVVLAEFIIPVNNFLPKPSLFIDSFKYIWKDYQLLASIGYTVSFIYSSMILAYILIFLTKGILIKFIVEFRQMIITIHLFRYVPLFLILVFVSYWFPSSIIAEFIAAVILSLFHLIRKIFLESKNVKSEYLTVARNLGVPNAKVYGEIFWKELQPKLLSSLNRLQLYLWWVLLIYEFVGDANGIGAVIRSALAFNDYIALIYLILIVTLIIWWCDFLITQIERKLVFWNK